MRAQHVLLRLHACRTHKLCVFFCWLAEVRGAWRPRGSTPGRTCMSHLSGRPYKIQDPRNKSFDKQFEIEEVSYTQAVEYGLSGVRHATSDIRWKIFIYIYIYI